MKLYNIEEVSLYTKGPKRGLPNSNCKVKLKCDSCFKNFLRLFVNAEKSDHHICQRCVTINYNKTRDPVINAKMLEKATLKCKGKTFEEINPNTAERRRKEISERTKGKNNPMYGKHEHTHGWKKEKVKLMSRYMV